MAEKQEDIERSAATVTVACKLPHGIWMEVQDGNKPKTRILAKGCNTSNVIGGFGLTENVPADFFEAWIEKNKSLKFVQRGQIWALNRSDSVRKKALEMAELKHGVERLDPDKPPAGLIETEESKQNRAKKVEQAY